MNAVKISEFRANLLYYLQEAREGKEITVTSRGEAIATLSPPVDRRKDARAQLNRLAKSAVLGDVLSPTGERCEAEA